MTKKTTTKKTPTKKTTTKRAPSKAKQEAEVIRNLHHDENGVPCLTEMQVLQWKSAMAESELAKATWRGKEKDLEIFLLGIPEYKTLRTNADSAKHEFSKKSRDYMAALTRLSESIGLDLTNCIINDNTGKLTFLDKDGKITGDLPLLGKAKKV